MDELDSVQDLVHVHMIPVVQATALAIQNSTSRWKDVYEGHRVRGLGG